MKDAQGHGSNARGSFGLRSAPTIKTGSLKTVGLNLGFRASSAMKPDHDYRTDADRTVAELRSQMQNTGQGHQTALGQGVKNLSGEPMNFGRFRGAA